MKKCPKCSNINNFAMERSPFGQTKCLGCGFRDKHEKFGTVKPSVMEALEAIAVRDMPDDPDKTRSAIEWLKTIQDNIPAIIAEMESGIKKKKESRKLCYEMANIVMQDWFRYYFK